MDIQRKEADALADELSPLARRVRDLRKRKGMTLRDLSAQSGVSFSNLSKLETGKLSPTFDTIERVASGFGISISALLSFEQTVGATNRLAVTRKGQGVLHHAGVYTYEALCANVTDKAFVPLLAKIHAQDRKDFGPLLSHEGEEILFVLDGQVEVQTEFHDPVVLNEGDCIFFDSTMGHACLTRGLTDATVFWVHSALSRETAAREKHSQHQEKPNRSGRIKCKD